MTTTTTTTDIYIAGTTQQAEQTASKECSSDLRSDIHLVTTDNKKIILIGTAHISKASVDLVNQVIETEKPDCVCVELDDKRYESLAKRKRWEILDLKEIIRKKQLGTLLINLIMASYQKKLGNQLGVTPGAELLEATKTAKKLNIPISLCDRDVRVTMRRAWRATSFFKKSYLLASIFASMFDRTEITEEKLQELKQTDALSELMAELGATLPELKHILIDERDTFLAEKIKATKGDKLVAVVGAGHVAGIKQALTENRQDQMEEINTIPPISAAWKIIGWMVPIIILSSLGLIAWQQGGHVAADNLRFWILVNSIPAALGAILAMAHPLTIAGAFVAAPITSLTPVIGAGYVVAFLQLMLRPPVVIEFETVLKDIGTFTGWWRNRLLRVLLVFIFTSTGSMIGTWVGGYRIVSTLL